MKPFTATLLAAALSAAFVSASAADAKPDQAQYRNATAKAASDYTAAAADCKDKAGNEKQECLEEAKVDRARAELAAVTEHNNVKSLRTKARTTLANAEYALAKVECADDTGAEKTTCLSEAKAANTAALADAKADRAIALNPNADDKGTITNTTSPRDADKRAAVAKCEQIAGGASTGCLIDKDGKMTPVAGAAATAGAVAERTGNVAERAIDKTKEVARNAVDKTRQAVTSMGDNTERAADNTGDATERAAANTGIAATDTAITTKVKAGLFKEPALKALDIHVETDKGVVMLSGFVDSKATAERAERVAKDVEGVKQVKSAIKVK